MRRQQPPRRIEAGDLDVAYLECGDPAGTPVLLMHGFPYSADGYADVAAVLAKRGHRVIVPSLRGFGGTRLRSPRTPRSGQQAALGADLLALLDTLAIERAVLAGYDWGGRAACIVAALWPQRVAGLVSVNGYNVQDIAASARPALPDAEHRLWYQYYFHGERGRAGLQQHRRELCRLLWRQWSPSWSFDEATYTRSAADFDNPDFVDIVIHSYRHRFALVDGDPRLEPIERALAGQPAIAVPTITIEGADDGVMPPAGSGAHAHRFTGPREHRVLAGVGHNPPQEAPAAFAQAVIDVQAMR